MGNYTVIDHTYDAIVVGAGGAGLRVSKSIFLLIYDFRLHLVYQRPVSRLLV